MEKRKTAWQELVDRAQEKARIGQMRANFGGLVLPELWPLHPDCKSEAGFGESGEGQAEVDTVAGRRIFFQDRSRIGPKLSKTKIRA